MSFFITEAMAAATSAPPAAAAADGSFSLLMVAAIFVLFYFMIIRPHNKRAKDQRALMSKLKKGDEVVTSGGILAKIVDLDDQYLKVALSDTIEINIQRSAVTAILPKGTLKSL